MGVHDNADSKYSVINGTNFLKFTPKKPTLVNFGETSSNKVLENETNQKDKILNDKSNINVQQQRKSLPVYKLRER